MIRLLLVDDHEIVRRGLRELLESNDDLSVVAEAGTLDDALKVSTWTTSTSRCSTYAYPTAAASTCADCSTRRDRTWRA